MQNALRHGWQLHRCRIKRRLLSQPTIQGLANAFRVSLAYEATFRWDDYADMTLGDFIVTNDFVRVFLVETKTDSYKTVNGLRFLRPYAHMNCIDGSLWPSLMSSIPRK